VKRQLWKKDWFLGLVVCLFFLLATGTNVLRGLEWSAYDLGVRFSTNRPANDKVVVIAVDPASLRALGHWPWPRDEIATVTRQVAAAGAATIGITLPFDSPQNARGLEYIRELRSVYDSRWGNASNRMQKLLRRAESGLDTDGVLASGLSKAGDVVLAMTYQPKTGDGSDLAAPPRFVADQALKHFKPIGGSRFAFLSGVFSSRSVPVASALYTPIEVLGKAAAGIGHIPSRESAGQEVRALPLVVRYDKQYYPSFALQLTARSLHVNVQHIKVEPDYGVSIDGEKIRTDSALYIHPYFYSPREGKPPFKVYSFADVLHHKIPLSSFKGKTVLIGLTATHLVDTYETPLGNEQPPVMVMANTVSSLLNGDLYSVPKWTFKAQALALIVIALYLMYILPRFRVSTGLALSALLFIALLNAHFILMMSDSIWLQLMGAMAALVVGHVLFTGKRMLEQSLGRFQAELSESNRMLGISFQTQGQLDLAFDKFRKCTPGDSLLDALYNLGLDYERKRQFNKAIGVFRYIESIREGFRDAKERIERNEEMDSMFVLGKGGGGNSAGTLIISKNGVQKPMLGRYQVERELGRGAMGLVYLGRDPKIGRTVAIKTMALSQEFESDQLEDVRKRFFREAETAGRLNHPNIVTIYDVGEDQELAYIAMDYLKGDNLLSYCKPDELLPAEKVFEIIIQVAEALDYAHNNNVVHRDIKPANIIYDQETGTVKVTDFGVAHLTDSSKTRTGTILGSPSYMSPEQLAGKRVDGRSDLFSLGITLYQLLTGELPFIGESLASLMYKIANEKHPDVRMFRPDLPPCVSKVVNKALNKEIDKRFQSGVQMSNAMRRCQDQLHNG